MRNLTLVFISAVLAASTISVPAEAKWHDDHDYYRGYDRGHDYNHNRDWDHGDRDNRDWRHDNGRHEGWYKNHRWYSSYHYQPYQWEYVNVYTAPTYYAGRNVREVRCVNEVNPFGILLGGLAGGAIGSTIGHGHGRDAAIASGAVIGGLLGNSITQQRCQVDVFRDTPVGVPVSWQAGPREAYAVVPTREYRDGGQYCREYQAYARISGKRSETYGMACMQPDGSWEVVS